MSTEDTTKLIEEVEELFAEGWCVCRSSHLPGDLLEAIKSLAAENEKLRAERDEFKRLFGECHPVHLDGVQEARRLQAQLDSMTVETRVRRVAVDGQGKIIGGVLIPEKRRVGPWVEVSETRGNVSTSKPADDHICDTDCHEDQYGIQWHTVEVSE